MKQHLDEKSRKAIVDYRMEKSSQAFIEADLMAQNNLFDSAVTRLYYACYYLASALLIKNEIEATSHAGVKRMLSLNFIVTGKVDQIHIHNYSDLMNGRQLSDYEDFVFQTSTTYQQYREEAKEFCKALLPLLTS